MIPSGFDYHAPRSVGDAIKLLGQYAGDAKLLAGGHSLLPMMKLRFAAPAHLIDLNRIDSLRGIREEGGTIVIGAMTVENELIRSTLLQQKVPLLPEAAKQIADPQVRNRGTIGGDIAHGDPGNDHPALSMAIDAEFVLEGPNGTRTVQADGFFQGTYMTDMAEDEIMIAIRVPGLRAGHRLRLPEAQAQDRRLGHRRRRRRAAHGRRQREPRAHRADQPGADRAARQRRRGRAARQAARPRPRSPTPRSARWRSATRPRTCAATSNTRPRWPARWCSARCAWPLSRCK